MVALLDDHGFVGTAADRVHGHGTAARESDLDDAQVIDRLTEFGHLAANSDGFGFDVLGWVPDESSSGGGYAIALEVKSASGSFSFSSGEWACAERLRDAYAMLAVRRRPGSEAPAVMDLLVDLVRLCESGQRMREADTDKIRYARSE